MLIHATMVKMLLHAKHSACQYMLMLIHVNAENMLLLMLMHATIEKMLFYAKTCTMQTKEKSNLKNKC